MLTNGPETGTEQIHFGEITRILETWNIGDEKAVDNLMPHVVNELRQMARATLKKYLPHSRDNTLQPTAIVNEAYLKLRGVKNSQMSERGAFYALCAEIIKHIIIDYLRRKSAARRGGGIEMEPLDKVLDFGWIRNRDSSTVEDVFAFQEVLERLAVQYQRESRVIVLKYYLGLTDEEIAESIQVSTPTVRRDLTFAKAWIRREVDSMAATIYTQAADIHDSTERQKYLDEACADDHSLLKNVAILLKKAGSG